MTHGRSRPPERLSQALTDLIALRVGLEFVGTPSSRRLGRGRRGIRSPAEHESSEFVAACCKWRSGIRPCSASWRLTTRRTLLAALSRDHPELKIRDLKFVMRGNLFPR